MQLVPPLSQDYGCGLEYSGSCALELQKGNLVLDCILPSVVSAPSVASCAQGTMQKYEFPRPVLVKDYPKDVPERLLVQGWQRTVDFNKLPKIQLRVKMCCAKCEEKVLEEIWEVPGVFDVRASRIHNKVVVTAAIEEWNERVALDEYAVLRKARKIDCKARFVELDPSERQPVPKPKPPVGPKPPAPERPTEYTGYPPPEYRPPPPLDRTYPPLDRTYPPPPNDGVVPFYFLFLVLLLVSLMFFRK